MTAAITITLGGQPVESAGQVLREMRHLSLDVSEVAGKANSYHCGIGIEPAVGRVLMLAQHLRQLSTSEFHELVLKNSAYGPLEESTITIKDVVIRQAFRIVPGYHHDDNALYVVLLTDRRFLADMTCIQRRYNVGRIGTWGASATTSDDENDEAAAADLVSDLSSILTVNKPLDSSVYLIGTPDPATAKTRQVYEGVSALRALDNLARIYSMRIVFNPFTAEASLARFGDGTDATNVFNAAFGGMKISEDGAESLTAGDDSDALGGYPLLDNTETLTGSWNYPATIKVHFPRSDYVGGFDATTPRYHVVEVSPTDTGSASDYHVLPDDDAFSGTCVALFADATAQFMEESTTPANGSDLDDIAERMAKAFWVSRSNNQHGRLIYSGAQNVQPGVYIADVMWRDFGDGLKTEILRRETWPETVTAHANGDMLHPWQIPHLPGIEIRAGVLDEALAAPDSIGGTPTTASVSRYGLASGTLSDTGETDEITNFNPSLTAASGAEVWYTNYGPKWVPIYTGCVEQNESQTITITGTPTGGTFTLSFEGETTSALNHNSSAATVQAALEALSSIGSGNVSCSGGDLPGTAIVVTFQGDLANTDVDIMGWNDGSLTGGTSPTVTVEETAKGCCG